jgi:formiminotetrahydrofolate cyclodeaminase
VEDFLDLRVRDLLELVAAPEPAPGGGSVLAVAVALAAGVLTMAARVSPDWEDAGGAAAQAQALGARATPLAVQDAEAYRAALAVRTRVAELPAERRDWEIGRAFAQAAEPPLEITRLAVDVAQLAVEVAAGAGSLLRGDAIAAATLAAAAARAGAELVAVNLTAVDGDERVSEARRLADVAGRAADAVIAG